MFPSLRLFNFIRRFNYRELKQFVAADVDATHRGALQALKETRDSVLSERQGIAAELERLTITAPFAGRLVIYGAPRSLFGHYLRTILATLIRETTW